MTTRYLYPAVELAKQIAEEPWNITERGLAQLARHVERRLDDSITERQAEQGASWYAERIRASAAAVVDGVAVLRIAGYIFPKATAACWWFDGTALDVFGETLEAAVEDASVRAILIDVDSPGGLATGCEEASAKVYAARGAKPIVAVASGKACCSAAYYVASAADRLVASPSSLVGSIGSIVYHEERSKWLADLGVRITPIAFGKRKADGNPYQPLSKEARAALQEYVDDCGRQFVQAVARNRGISEQGVLEGYGQGAFSLAPRAFDAGWVDRLATYDEVFDELAAGEPPPRFTQQEAEESDMAEDKKQPPAEPENQPSPPAAPIEPPAAAPAAPAAAAPQPAPPAASRGPSADEIRSAARSEAAEIAARCKLAGVDPTEYLAAGLSLAQVTEKLLASVCEQRKLTPDAGEPPQVEAKPDETLRSQYRGNAAIARDGVSEDQYVARLNGGELDYIDLVARQKQPAN